MEQDACNLIYNILLNALLIICVLEVCKLKCDLALQ